MFKQAIQCWLNITEKNKDKNLFEQLDKIQPLVALKDGVEFVVVGEHVQGVPVQVHEWWASFYVNIDRKFEEEHKCVQASIEQRVGRETRYWWNGSYSL